MSFLHQTLVFFQKILSTCSRDGRWEHSDGPRVVPRLTGGFSLVELIIAIGIFVMLSITLLFNYGTFDRRITVDVLAHQIAVWVHDAQVSAMSVKRTRNVEGKFPGYGLHFDMATSNKFIYFADLNGDHVYTPPGGSLPCGDPTAECEQEVALLQGNVVTSLCGDMPQGAQTANCASATPGNPMLYSTNVLDIVFVRPNPSDATIFGDANTSYSHAEITVASPKGYRHTITVWITGQVSVR